MHVFKIQGMAQGQHLPIHVKDPLALFVLNIIIVTKSEQFLPHLVAMYTHRCVWMLIAMAAEHLSFLSAVEMVTWKLAGLSKHNSSATACALAKEKIQEWSEEG